MTSKNFNRVLTVVVNKLNKCHFNFTKPENMKSVTIERSVFLVNHELGLEIDDCDMFLYITVDGRRMNEIDLDNEVKDSNELFNRVQYLLSLAYADIYNGNYDEEFEEFSETEEPTEDYNEYDEYDEYDEISEIEDLERELDEAADCNEHEEILDSKESTDRDRINYFMETHSFPSISDIYNDKCFCCPADRKGNECKGKETCGKTWKRYEAITNPEWHHVSLATLTNLDFDMLDEKRQTYLTAYRDLKQTLSYLRKCKTVNTYSACYNRYLKRLNVMRGKSKITNAMYKYIEAKLSMQNVESGLWSSAWEAATGSHESRRYNKSRA